MKLQKFILLLIITMFPLTLLAHAPKKVNLLYDQESGKLSVSVLHKVKNVEEHHIAKLIVSVNGEEVNTLNYQVQSSLETHQVEIDLPGLKSADEVSVKAICNKVGSKTGKLEIK